MTTNYPTTAEADAYFATRLNATAWSSATTANKTAALTGATNVFASVVSWRDAAFSTSADGASRSLVAQAKNALFEEAIWLLKLDPTDYPELLTLGVASSNGTSFDRAFVAPLLSPVAVRLVGDLGDIITKTDGGGSCRSSFLSY